MTDIYGIQPLLLDNFIDYKFSFIYLIVVIIILITLYYIYKRNKVIIIDNSPIINKRDFSVDLDLLYEKYLSSQREIFYSKLL